MSQNQRDHDLLRALGFVEEGESRVARQRKLILKLKVKKRPTQHAESVLQTMENSLHHLRNYLAILQELKRPD